MKLNFKPYAVGLCIAAMMVPLAACGHQSSTTTNADLGSGALVQSSNTNQTNSHLSSETVQANRSENSSNSTHTSNADNVSSPVADGYQLSEAATQFVNLQIAGRGHIVIELKPEVAPLTVQNFQKLVSEHFYDGLIFHRIIPDFMIQGGDPTGTGMGGAPENIKGEFASNGVPNKLSHKRGVLSMARAQNPDSASSQFFICHKDSTFLDGDYAAFGEVVSGMDIVDQLAMVETDHSDRPIDPPTMEHVFFVKPN